MKKFFKSLLIAFSIAVSFSGGFSAYAVDDAIAEKYKKLFNAQIAFEKEIRAARLAVALEGTDDIKGLRKNARTASFDVLVNGEKSNNPDHLKPFLDATWVFIYETTSSLFPDWDPRYSLTAIFFDSEIQAVQDSMKLSCHDGYDRACEMVAYTTSDSIAHYLRIANDDPEYPQDYVYIMELSGNVAEGKQAYLDEDTETIIGEYPMTGFKWGSPVCDKNYDDKLGLAEAIHYLRLVAGE